MSKPYGFLHEDPEASGLVFSSALRFAVGCSATWKKAETGMIQAGTADCERFDLKPTISPCCTGIPSTAFPEKI